MRWLFRLNLQGEFDHAKRGEGRSMPRRLGRKIRFQQGLSGERGGDPEEAAGAMFHISQVDPPLRLVLGTDTFNVVHVATASSGG